MNTLPPIFSVGSSIMVVSSTTVKTAGNYSVYNIMLVEVEELTLLSKSAQQLVQHDLPKHTGHH